MSTDRLPGTELMRCARGLYEGTTTYTDGPFKGQSVHGVFSYVNIDGPCHRPVRNWCKRRGSNHAWLACDLPEHRQDAEVVLPLEEEHIAFLVWQQNPLAEMPEILRNRTKRNPFLDAPKKVITVDEPKPKKRIPRNKGTKAKKRARTLLEALEGQEPKTRGEAFVQAIGIGLDVAKKVMQLNANDRDKRKR